MVKDCLFSLSNTPEDLKKIIRNSSVVCSSGVSCNVVNGKYVNITGVSDLNSLKLDDALSLERILNDIKPRSLFEIALCFKVYNDFLFNKCAHIEESKILQQTYSGEHKRNNRYEVLRSFLKDSRG